MKKKLFEEDKCGVPSFDDSSASKKQFRMNLGSFSPVTSLINHDVIDSHVNVKLQYS